MRIGKVGVSFPQHRLLVESVLKQETFLELTSHTVGGSMVKDRKD